MSPAHLPAKPGPVGIPRRWAFYWTSATQGFANNFSNSIPAISSGHHLYCAQSAARRPSGFCGSARTRLFDDAAIACTRGASVCRNVRKTILYLDQFVISNLMLIRSSSKQVQPFYRTLYDKLACLSTLQAIVCPRSEAHSVESVVSVDGKRLRSGFEMFAQSVRFEGFDNIRTLQVFDRLSRWLANDSSKTCSAGRKDILRGDAADFGRSTLTFLMSCHRSLAMLRGSGIGS
jgi:hypothetical protein